MHQAVYYAGWILVLGAAILAGRMHRLDRQMQRFRSPAHDASAYRFVPLRWQRRLYAGEGQELVGPTWRTFVLMIWAGVLGLALISAGPPS